MTRQERAVLKRVRKSLKPGASNYAKANAVHNPASWERRLAEDIVRRRGHAKIRAQARADFALARLHKGSMR